MILLPIVLVIVIVALIFGGLFNGIQVEYSEEDFQDYANERYFEYFGTEKDYEDQLLLVVLVENDDYHYIDYMPWMGTHIDNSVRNMFGDGQTQLAQLLDENVTSFYKYSLSSDLANVFDALTEKIGTLNLESSFTCKTEHGAPTAQFVNESRLSIDSSTLETALNNFATETGISTVVLVANMDDVQPTSYTGLIVSLVLIAVIVIIVILLINKKKKPTDGDRYQPNGRY